MDDTAALAGLDALGIADRAEAARVLGLTGGPPALDPLLQRAIADRSAGVRLAAAGAVADILSRHRLPPWRDAVPDAVRQNLLRRVRSMDPGVNPALFQVIGTSGVPGAIRGLVPGLRDPRADVRTGALVGLERLVISATSNGDPEVYATLGALLAERRLRPEIAVEVARLAARTGHPGVETVLEALATSCGTLGLKAVGEIRALMDRWMAAACPWGVWTTRGRDAGEVNEAAGPRRWLVLGGEIAVEGGDDRLSPFACGAAGPDLLRFREEVHPLRCLLVPYDGADDAEVLQIGPFNWRRATDREAVRPIETLVADRLVEPADRPLFVETVAPTLGRKAHGLYGRAILDLWADRPAEAVAGLATAAAAGRLPPEADLHRARALAALGRVEEALVAARAYLATAPRRSAWLGEARSLAGEA